MRNLHVLTLALIISFQIALPMSAAWVRDASPSRMARPRSPNWGSTHGMTIWWTGSGTRTDQRRRKVIPASGCVSRRNRIFPFYKYCSWCWLRPPFFPCSSLQDRRLIWRWRRHGLFEPWYLWLSWVIFFVCCGFHSLFFLVFHSWTSSNCQVYCSCVCTAHELPQLALRQIIGINAGQQPKQYKNS